MRRWLLVILCAAACEDAPPVIDRFPIAVGLDAGVPLLGARSAALQGGEIMRVVVDTASPITVLDDASGLTRRRRLELELLRYPLSPAIARARFPATRALLDGVGAVGFGEAVEIGGVIGGDLLALQAVRLDPTRGELTFFPDFAGSDDDQDNACKSVFKVTLAGAGSYVSGNDVVDYLPTRVVLGACLAPTVPDEDDAGGSDSLLLLATGSAPTILSRTAYRAAAGVDDATIDALPTTTMHLPSDTMLVGEQVRVATLPRLAITGNARNRGPCRELTVSRIMARRGCTERAECNCDNDSGDPCAAASVELDAAIDVVILQDTHPLLQSLRNELRPTFAEIGGLLGMRALGPLVTDLDYPNGRVLVECAAGSAGCVARPRVADTGREESLRARGCLPPL